MAQVAIRNPETGGVAVMTQEQFDTLYTARGWEIVDVDPAFASTVVGVTVADLSELDPAQLAKVVAAHETVDPATQKSELMAMHASELRDHAESLGLATSGTKEELADRIIEHKASATD